jgi:hypothetical protein
MKDFQPFLSRKPQLARQMAARIQAGANCTRAGRFLREPPHPEDARAGRGATIIKIRSCQRLSCNDFR